MLYAFVKAAQKQLKEATPTQRARLEKGMRPIADALFYEHADMLQAFLESRVAPVIGIDAPSYTHVKKIVDDAVNSVSPHRG